MNVTKSSLLYFTSRIAIAALGFIGTVYATRIVGATVYGQFALFIAIVGIGNLLTSAGLNLAANKRISENWDPDEVFTAYLVLKLILLTTGLIVLWIFKTQIENYIGVPWITPVIAGALILSAVEKAFNSALHGGELVGVAATYQTIKEAARVGAWVVLIYLGYQLDALLAGYLAGIIAFIALATYTTDRSLARPRKKHFKSIWSYAKYSWLGRTKGHVLGWADTIILGMFLTASVVGVYEATWRVSKLFTFASVAISSSMFPTLSRLNTNGNNNEAIEMIEEGLVYVSIISIPGLVGGAILAEPVMEIFGAEFKAGGPFLVILLVGVVFRSYENAFQDVVYALNHPSLAFRVSLTFIAANVALNFILIPLYGGIGAAIATTTSIVLAMALFYFAMNRIISVSLPVKEIGYQLIATTIMGVLVLAASRTLEPLNVVELITIIALGAAVYGITLLHLSTMVRHKVIQIIKDISSLPY